MKRVFLVFCIATVLVLAAITTGCNCSMEGYRTFTFDKVAHFAFEYPAHYSKYSAGADVVGDYRAIFIGFRDNIPSKGMSEGYITIYAEGAGITYPDATAALEDTLSGFFEPEPWEEYEYEPKRLLELSTLTVAGIQAELIVYSYGWESIREESTGLWVYLMRIAREVYFDHDNLIWQIVIESDEDRAEVAEADFEHLLETFQILD